MNSTPIIEAFKKAGISPTPVRLMIFQELDASQSPLSLNELELRLDSVDKSSISRTLNLFRKHHLVHSFNDGSGSVKYEICHRGDSDAHDDLHVHFRCEICGKTLCLQDIKVPGVVLPKGFVTKEINYIIVGQCPDCNKQLSL